MSSFSYLFKLLNKMYKGKMLWYFWPVVLDKTLERDCKGIKPVNPKENQSWMFIGRADAEAETPIVWPADMKNWLIGKDPDAGKDWRQEEKGMTEDEMVGWHHQHYGHEFEQALGVADGQGSLACCSPWGHKESELSIFIELKLLWDTAAILRPQNHKPENKSHRAGNGRTERFLVT